MRIQDRFFPQSQRVPAFASTPDAHWNSWIWQQQKRIKTIHDLRSLMPITDEEAAIIEASADHFHWAMTPYYASLIEPNNPQCPIRLHAIPSQPELTVHDYEMHDPLAEETHMPTPGLTHRYPDRVLLYSTHNCPVYCRHCTRKRKVANPATAHTNEDLKKAFTYIADHPEVRDVLISGGDPLSNSDGRLHFILSHLRAIPHIEIIRLCTRNIVTLPQRITPELCQMLQKFGPIYVNTHFNHPRECTREAFDAAALLMDIGHCVVSNQMVLLKGINDNAEIVKSLNQKLLLMRIRPYYILQCDMVSGLSHFRTSLQTGIDIIDALRGHTSGLAVPHYVVDLPGGGGKISLVPQYTVEKTDKKWTFRNYAHRHFTYIDSL